MGKVRGHEPFVIEQLNGLWARGDDESCPSDHMLLADNIQFIHSGIETRTAIKPYSMNSALFPLRYVKRVYTYNTTFHGQTLLVMTQDGNIYHVIGKDKMFRIIVGSFDWDDFAFIAIAGRAYFSPFKTYTNPDGRTYSLGLKDQGLYVYDGNKDYTALTVARLAGGVPPTTVTGSGGYPQWNKPFLAYTSAIKGTVTQGYHAFGVTYGSIYQIGPRVTGTGNDPAIFAIGHSPGDKAIELTGIPIGPVGTVQTLIYMSKANVWKPGSNELYLIATLPYNPTLPYTYRVDVADAALTQAYVAGTEPAPFKGALTVENFIPPPPPAGQPPTPAYCDLGFHLVGVVYETNTGFLTAPGPEFFGGQTYANESWSIRVSNIPKGDATVVKRHLVSTKAIPEYNGDQKGYQFFFIPNGTIENNTETIKVVNYYDSDLVADASHLTENFTKIPAGVNFCEYHSRLVIVGDAHFPKNDAGVEDTTKPDNRSVAWVSAPGEPEAINQVDGLIVVPLDSNPLTNCQDFRDVLYLFKSSRTYAVSDNGDDPTTWGPVEVLDQGIGASVHGIADVLDSGGVNVDYLIIVDWSGLMLFNGTYARPELSWKIEDIWLGWDRNLFRNIQIVNDSIGKKIWIVDPQTPTRILWLADYGNGMDPKAIRWAKWWLEPWITSATLIQADHLVLGATIL